MGKWKCNQASNMFLHIQTPFFSSLHRLPLQPNAVKKIKSLLESYANTNFVRLVSCEKWRYSIIYMGFTLLHLIYWKQAISHKKNIAVTCFLLFSLRTQETMTINKQQKIIIAYIVLRKATQWTIEHTDKCSIEGVH